MDVLLARQLNLISCALGARGGDADSASGSVRDSAKDREADALGG